MRAGLLIFVVLSGCATESSLRTNEPYFSTATQKPRGEVAQCILNNWASEKFLTLRRTEGTDRTTIIASFGSIGGEDMIADVTDTRVEMHRRPAIWSGADIRLRDAAARCAAA